MKLGVTATADFTPIYQWFHNNTALVSGSAASGVNMASLALTNIQAAQAGSYTVSLSDSAGNILSDSAIIVVKGALAVMPKATFQQSKSLTLSNKEGIEYIDLAGHVIVGKNAAAASVNNYYLTRDLFGKWVRYFRMGN